MRARIKEVIQGRIGRNRDAVRELIHRTVGRDMHDGQDRAVDTLMSGGTDYAIEILARVQEAHWIDALEGEINEVLAGFEPTTV